MPTAPKVPLLRLPALAAARKLPEVFLRELGLRDAPGGVSIPYFDWAKTPTHEKLRRNDASKPRFLWPSGVPPEPYGRWKLAERADSARLILCEGESDCWTLWWYGLPALGIPGANNTRYLEAQDLQGTRHLVVVREPGQSGRAFVPGILSRLKELNWHGDVLAVDFPVTPKDPSALHQQAGERFLAFWEQLCSGGERIDLNPAAASAPAALPCPEDGAEWDEPLPLAEPPAPLPFPLHVLPGRVRVFVEEVASSTNSPPDYPAAFCLVLAGGAIGSSLALRIKEGWTERPSLYLAVVAPTGSGKTPSLLTAAAPFFAEHERRRNEYRAAHKTWDKAPEYDREDEPTLQSAYIGNCTVEALAKELAACPRGFIRIEDEITGWATGLDQYRSGGKGSDRQSYLSLWSGAPLSVHRAKDQEPLYIPYPFLSVCGGLPPGCLDALKGDRSLLDGWFDRLLFAYPEPLPARGETWCVIRQETRDSWQRILRDLWEVEMDKDAEGVYRPKWQSLTQSGRHAWEDFTTLLAAQLNHQDFPEFLRGPYHKLRSYGARLAIILQALRWVCAETTQLDIDGESLQAAGELVNYFAQHARRVYCALDADAEVAACKRILHHLDTVEGCQVKRSELYRELRNRTTVTSPEELDRLLLRLEKNNYLRQISTEKGSGAGRPPGPTYLLNPLWKRARNTFNTRNSPVG